MNYRLRDLRPNPADYAIRAHHANRGDSLKQMLCGNRVNGRHAGDINNSNFGSGLNDSLEQ